MLLFGLIILLVGVLGIIVTLTLFVTALFSKSNKWWKRIGFSILTTITLVITLILIQEVFVFPPNPRTDELVMSAYREAPIGGIWLGLYSDSTWELGNSSREIRLGGTYTIDGDKLNLKALKGTTFSNGELNNSFLINQTDLIEIENTGINGLEIGINRMNKNGL
ncbi:hypothetical protein SAMN05421823_104502 [Catalinimonas alkaloidigena]|uniref:Uncharacterized protein n=1 Tax=Catalinimonas alkaloidigena TaxID=1075417 RepID=A0A1G9HQC2_9BACT|nr:hypothetical protein [Catalinimonas alkaloidigena]SDL15045.1 hypothetical protein SAMN05421823_104502 [Catalinimonas alkaloidigena]